MYGHLLVASEQLGWRAVLSREEILGLPLLRAEVPGRPELGGRALRRKLYRAAERLWGQGISRVLVPPEFPHRLWEPLCRAGLRGVEVEPLCQAVAAKLILKALERRGLIPARSTVCLAGEGAGGALQRTAQELARSVGRLAFDAGEQGRRLTDWLGREFGLPRIEPGSLRPDLTVAFAPQKEPHPADLRLYGQTPDLGGLRLTAAERSLPADAAELPLLAALWESGRLREREIRAVVPLDRRI